VITQRQAAEELGQTERHIRRLLKQVKAKGDKAIVHALRGQRSNRKVDEKVERVALEILSREVYAGSRAPQQCRVFRPDIPLPESGRSPRGNG
jgi:hypothetical protein